MFSGQQNILTIPVAFVEMTGDLESALLLNQILYWSDRTEEEWFYKTNEDWQEELKLSKHKLLRAKSLLVKLGLIQVKTKKIYNGNPVSHYWPDSSKIAEWFVRKSDKGKSENQNKESLNFSITSISKKTTLSKTTKTPTLKKQNKKAPLGKGTSKNGKFDLLYKY